MLYDIVKVYNRQEEQRAQADGKAPVLLPHISLHTLRHTFCSRMVEIGVEPKVLQGIMGHSNISITMDAYTHIDEMHAAEQMKLAEGKPAFSMLVPYRKSTESMGLSKMLGGKRGGMTRGKDRGT